MAAQRSTSSVCIARAGLTAAVALGLTTVFAERAWLGAALLAAIAPHAIFAWTDRRKVPTLTTVAILLACAFVFTLYAVEPHTTSNGLPTGETFSHYFEDLRDAPHVLRTAIVPVPANGSALLLALLALFVAGAIAEWSARRLDASIGALGPSLVLFVAIAALGEGGWGTVTIAYALAAALYLVALHQAEMTERRSWFHAANLHRSRVLQGGVAGAIGVVLAAAIIAPLLPGSRSDAWFDYRSLGDGEGGGLLKATTPIVSIRAKLLEQPDHTVFTVDIDDASPVYWRVIALDKYDGTLWTLEDTGEPADDLSKPDELQRFEELEQRIEIADADPHWLPAAFHPIEINLENALVVEDSATMYLKPDDQITDLEYEVTSYVPVIDEADKLAAPPVEPSRFARYLDLPTDFPPRVRERAEELTREYETPWEKADALARYLNSEGGFTYNAEVARDHSIETLEEFLLTTQEGYCEQFASAFAAMARSIGLPTRIAVGYSYGTRTNGVWVVKNRDAHAWPEVYFTGLGWVPLEPTPGRGANVPGGTQDPTERPAVSPTESDSGAVTTTTSASGATPPPSVTIPPGERNGDISLGESSTSDDGTGGSLRQFLLGLAAVAGVLLVAAVVGLCVLVFVATRRTWHRRHAPDARDRVLGAWAQALDHLADAGVEPKPSATPIEFALRYAPAHGAGDAGPALMELAQLQTAALFAPGAPSGEDAELAWHQVDAIDGAISHMISRLARWRRRLDPRRLRGPVTSS
jgi:transglutaminase-like putative cysteine protease